MNTILNHRTIRSFSSKEVEQGILDKILYAATRASNTGNMQMYTLVVTRSIDIREKLAPCHFNQPCAKDAPIIVTVCVDVNRFSHWCRLRDTTPEYDNLIWFLNGSIDALLASQNLSLAAESEGLGICYLGTTLYNADKIIDILDLPKGVIPITTIAIGYPEITPEKITDRLPVESVVMYDKYIQYTDSEINQIWKEKENSDETLELLKINDLPNLAQIFTTKRYTGADNILFSKKYLEVLRSQGFLNNEKE